MEDIHLEFPNLEFIQIPQRKEKGTTYSGTERIKLVRYSLLVDTLVNRLSQLVNGHEPIIVSIEGMAYGAQGNALVDIAQSTGMLKKSILEKILTGHSDNMFIFSPGELKNAIGAKGNAGKYDIFTQFKDFPGPALGSDLHSTILKYEDTIVNDQQVKSPFSDMIDSYLAVLKIHESLKES